MGRILSYIVKNKKFAASTENSPANAWNLNFDNGNRYDGGKVDYSFRVRPVTALVRRVREIIVMVKAEYIIAAYEDCRKGKASSPDAIRFETYLFENITDLVEKINSRTYEPMPSITFVVSRPVYREVFAANFVIELFTIILLYD